MSLRTEDVKWGIRYRFGHREDGSLIDVGVMILVVCDKTDNVSINRSAGRYWRFQFDVHV